MGSWYARIGNLVPRFLQKPFRDEAFYAGESSGVVAYIGKSLLLSVLAGVAAATFPLSWGLGWKWWSPLLFLGVFGLCFFLAYLLVYFRAEDRTARIETALPDVLQLIAANVRAGMTPFQALRLAARKEFGPLSEEIHKVTGQSLGTKSFSSLILHIGKRVRSDTVERALILFTTAMKSGGHLATLLEELAHDIDDTKALKQELITGTKMYLSFIVFSILLGTPLLLAVGIQFLEFITGIQQQSAGSTFGLGLSGAISITPTFLLWLSVILLIVTSLMASMLLGTLREGKMQYGLRYSPLLIGASLVFFSIFHKIIGSFFGTII